MTPTMHMRFGIALHRLFCDLAYQQMSNTHFTNLYKTWPADRLLDVLDNPQDYQPAAVEAARLELERRQLPADELKIAEAIRAERQNEKLAQQQKVKAVEDRIK